MDSVSIEVPRDVLDSARMTVADAKLELAVALYAQRRLSAGKARELAGMSLVQFRHVLAARRLPVHLDPADIDDDVATLKSLGRL